MADPTRYRVRPGDSLSSIAESRLGDRNRWSEIAKANKLHPPYNLLIGQELHLPAPIMANTAASSSAAVSQDPGGIHQPAWVMLARGSVFVVFRQVEANGKLVRKVVMLPPNHVAAMLVNNPEQFGFFPRNPEAAVSLGEHALGNTLSPYISASTKPGGAPNFGGKEFYIDIAKLKKSGATIHSTNEIIQDLDRLSSENPALRERIGTLKGVIDSVEGEALIRPQGRIPASAVQTAEGFAQEMKVFKTLEHGGRVVMVVGVLCTAYDLNKAYARSVKIHSMRPLEAESVRQVGGWGGGFIGGFWLGAACGIETGPGAIVTGLVGGIIGGVVGNYGGEWAARRIDPGR